MKMIMKKKKLRLVSFLLALIMVVNSVPMPTRADVETMLGGNEQEYSVASPSDATPVCQICYDDTCDGQHDVCEDCGEYDIACECVDNTVYSVMSPSEADKECEYCGTINCEKEHSICGVCEAVDCEKTHEYCDVCEKYDCNKTHTYCDACEKYDCKTEHAYCEVCKEYDCGIEHEESVIGRFAKFKDASAWMHGFDQYGNLQTSILNPQEELPGIVEIVEVLERSKTVTWYKLEAAGEETWPEVYELIRYVDSTELELIEEEPQKPPVVSEGISATLNGYTFIADSENLPENVTLSVEETDAAEEMETFGIKETVFAYDIKILNEDDSEWQPEEGEEVVLNIPVDADPGTLIGILHTHEDKTRYIGTATVEEDGTIWIRTNGFSTFVGFTVDFHYNGVDFSIDGMTSILLSELFEKMGIEEDAYAAKSVVFSDPDLVEVDEQDDGDWLLTSLEAFDTNETLIITFENGEVMVIDVTDPAAICGIGTLSYDNATLNSRKRTLTFYLYDVKDFDDELKSPVVTTSVTNVKKETTSTVSITEKGTSWYHAEAKGDCTLKMINDYQFQVEIGDGNGEVHIRRIPWLIVEKKESDVPKNYTINQERYTTIENEVEKRYVDIYINGVVDFSIDRYFPKVGAPIEQLTINNIRPGHYYLEDLQTKKEYEGRDPNNRGYYYSTKASNSKVLTYIGNRYTLKLLSRYTIVFDGNGHTSGSTANQPCIWGKSPESLPVNGFVRQHLVTIDPANGTNSYKEYANKSVFTGWSSDLEGKFPITEETDITKLTAKAGGNYTLYAMWDLGSVQLPEAPTKTGYDFSGWSDGSTTYEAGAYYKPQNNNVTFTAVWTPQYKYELTFDDNTNDVVTNMPTGYTSTDWENVDQKVYSWTEAPTRKGYTFQGWSTDQNATSGDTSKSITMTGTDAGTTQVKLYAIWTPIEYTVVFNGNNATSGLMNDQSFTFDDKEQALATNKFGKTGYIFQGWNTDSSAKSAKYINEQKVKNLADKSGDRVTLYAIWSPISYTVVFDGNGATGVRGTTGHTDGKMNNQKFVYDEEEMLNPNVYERKYSVTYESNYQDNPKPDEAEAAFNGWSTGDGRNISHTNEVSNLSSENGAEVKLYANWTLGSIKLPTLPEREDYTFVGWYSDSAFTNKVGVAGDSITPETNITLYAKWAIKTYEVTYDANGGTNAPSKQIKEHGSSLTLSTIIPTKDGCKFMGWAEAAGASAPQYNPGDIYNDNRTVTLYAVWGYELNVEFVTEIDGEDYTEGTVFYQYTQGGNTVSEPWGYEVKDVWYPNTLTGRSLVFGSKEGRAIKTVTVKVNGTVIDSQTFNYYERPYEYEYTFVNDLDRNTTIEVTFTAYRPKLETVIDNNGDIYAKLPDDNTLHPLSTIVQCDPGDHKNALVVFYPSTGYEIDRVIITKPNSSGEVIDTNPSILDDGSYIYAIGEAGITEDTKVEVKTKLRTYTIGYELNDGTLASGVANPSSYTMGTTINITNPTRFGYTFKGWIVTGSTATEEHNWNSTYVNINNLTNVYGSVVLKAEWELALTDLTIEVSGKTSGKNYIFNVDRVEGGTSTHITQVVLSSTKTSIKVKDLPVGNYVVTPERRWTWRQLFETSDQGRLTLDSPKKITYDCSFNNNKTRWLNGFNDNIWKGGGSN